MLKTIACIVLTLILAFIIIDMTKTNQKLMKQYKTDERRIYVRYPEKIVKKYVDDSKNWKIRYQSLILVIVFFIVILTGLYIGLKLGVTKLYLFFPLAGIIYLYSAWSLHEDHIFIGDYLKQDPENLLQFSILDEDIYNKWIYKSLRSGILLVVLPALFVIL